MRPAGLAITFDVDWAPDWCIDLCASIISNADAQATFFMTHSSPALDALRASAERFELGVHPNFQQGSSHGSTPREVLAYCMDIIPEARSMRTHGLFQATSIFQLVADEFEQIQSDASLLLPFHSHLQATELYLGRSRRRLIRLPCYWEDDIAAEWPSWDWANMPAMSSGLKIFAFHPIHIALNSDSLDRYQQLKASLSGKALADALPEDLQPFMNRGRGARSFLGELLEKFGGQAFYKISDLAKLPNAS